MANFDADRIVAASRADSEPRPPVFGEADRALGPVVGMTRFTVSRRAPIVAAKQPSPNP